MRNAAVAIAALLVVLGVAAPHGVGAASQEAKRSAPCGEAVQGGDGAQPTTMPTPSGSTRTRPVCPAVYQPVCGCDGRTYGNDCELRAAGAAKRQDGPC